MENGVTFAEQIRNAWSRKEVDIRTYSPLTLAYIGDSIYDLVVRTVVVMRGNAPANKLHHYTIRYVNAGAQAMLVDALQPFFTEEEQNILRRGRNAKPYTKAKHATMAEYKKATSLEALMGYLYLQGQEERLLELIRKGMELIEESGKAGNEATYTDTKPE